MASILRKRRKSVQSSEKRLTNQIWLLLTDTTANMHRHSGYYSSLVNSFNDHIQSTKNIIQNDIKRTYARTITQDTKDKMLRVLFGYAKRNMEMGYCQGMNFICYHFLEEGFSEEETFWILAHIFEQLINKDYYINMVPIIADVKLFKYLLKQQKSKLVAHIQYLSADLSFVLIPWFVMVFTNIQNSKVN